VAKQLAAVMGNEKVWRRTAFFLCYDEHGGFFDHVPPPIPPPGTPDEFVQGLPIGLGFRVPMIVCSPFTRGANVCRRTFDHTSLLQFVERRFGVHEPNISAWRRKTCGDLTAAFDFGHPDYSIPALPATGPLVTAATQDCKKPLPELPPVITSQPKQERGARQAVDFPEPKQRLHLTLKPATARAGVATRIAVTIVDDNRHHVAGATVRLGRHHTRTNAHGKATLRITFAKPGRYAVTAAEHGYVTARSIVDVH